MKRLFTTMLLLGAASIAAAGKFDMNSAVVPPCKARPLAVKQEKMPILGCDNWVETRAFDQNTFGLQWKAAALEPWQGEVRRGSFPEYCRQDGNELDAITSAEVPAETGLKAAHFKPAATDQAYTSPQTKDTVWQKWGPKAGPFQARLGDGSIVTYYWYRFVDQPALQDADLSAAEKERLQTVAEKIHRQWTMEKEYLPGNFSDEAAPATQD